MKPKKAFTAISFTAPPPPEVMQALLKTFALPSRGPFLRWHDPLFLTASPRRTFTNEDREALKDMETIKDVHLISGPLGLTGSFDQQQTSVQLPNGALLGSGSPSVIAGPCSVEEKSLILEIAHSVKEAGAVALRGGAFKPRTSPYSFGGLGAKGLALMAEARAKTGLPIVTEVLDKGEVDLIAHAADVLQIGARNMNNTSLLFELGKHPAGKPVLLKRGFSATISELLSAAEYVLLGRLAAENPIPNLILCERGIRCFNDATRFTLDLGAIPVLEERTNLPVIVDPSHAAGKRRYVPALSKAAVAAGAHGLLIEVHSKPEEAWCDGDQSMDLESFSCLLEELGSKPRIPVNA